MYWIDQQEKHHQIKDDCYWYPVDTEIRFMSERKRGQIDCVELCENKNGYRIIDYKAVPHTNDQLLLLFYASLFNESRLQDKENGKYEFNVLEIGCYYYEIGKCNVYNITEKNMKTFNRIFSETLEKIANQDFFLNKKFCWNCDLKLICTIEVARRF